MFNPYGSSGRQRRIDACFLRTTAAEPLGPGARRRKPSGGLRGAWIGGPMRRKVRSLVCAWMVVVLDAAVPPYAVGVSGEREGAACRRSGGRRGERGRRSPLVLVSRRPC